MTDNNEVSLDQKVRADQRGREKMGNRYRVEFELELPVSATDEQVEEWVKFAIGESVSLAASNHLSQYDMEVFNVSVDPTP